MFHTKQCNILLPGFTVTFAIENAKTKGGGFFGRIKHRNLTIVQREHVRCGAVTTELGLVNGHFLAMLNVHDCFVPKEFEVRL